MTQVVSENRDVTATRGRPFPPGNNANPNGRPKKGNAIRDVVRNLPVKDKREIVRIALQEVIENHDVAWAGWLLKAEGMPNETSEHSGPMRELIIREYGGFNPEAVE